MPVTHRVAVPPEAVGDRLDRFLAATLPDLSRSRLRQLIDDGQVTLSSGVARPSGKLKLGDEILVSVPPPRPLELVPDDRPLRILFQDAHLLVVEKPAGMVVHPGPGHAEGTLVHVLLSHADGLSGIGGVERPGIVHRLDRDTSGILVVAKTDAAHAGLCTRFATHDMVRRYHGIVWGSSAMASGTVTTRIGRHPGQRKKMAVLEWGGREAVTRYRMLETFGRFSRIEFELETGRTHQVRVHCAHLGCPIVGDDVYGKSRKISLGKGAMARVVVLERHFLHAFHLAFEHPVTGEKLSFTVDDPEEFGAFRDMVLAASGG